MPVCKLAISDAASSFHAARVLLALCAHRGPLTASWLASKGLYFVIYGEAKRLARERRVQAGLPQTLDAVDHFVCAGASGAGVSMLTNPVWVIKTRMAIGGGAEGSGAARGAGLAAMTRAMRSVWAREGIRGLYAGLGPSLLLASHGSVQFVAYEQMKRWAADDNEHASLADSGAAAAQLGGLTVAAMGAASKFAAMATTYPFSTVRARLQQAHEGGERAKYGGLVSAARVIAAKEGPAGFFKGFAPSALRLLPASAVTFTVYEGVLGALQSAGGGER